MSIDRDIDGTPRAIDEKVSAPNIRLRTINRLQRSARISEALAIGQYCRYLVMGSMVDNQAAVVEFLFRA